MKKRSKRKKLTRQKNPSSQKNRAITSSASSKQQKQAQEKKKAPQSQMVQKITLLEKILINLNLVYWFMYLLSLSSKKRGISKEALRLIISKHREHAFEMYLSYYRIPLEDDDEKYLLEHGSDAQIMHYTENIQLRVDNEYLFLINVFCGCSSKNIREYLKRHNLHDKNVRRLISIDPNIHSLFMLILQNNPASFSADTEIYLMSSTDYEAQELYAKTHLLKEETLKFCLNTGRAEYIVLSFKGAKKPLPDYIITAAIKRDDTVAFAHFAKMQFLENHESLLLWFENEEFLGIYIHYRPFKENDVLLNFLRQYPLRVAMNPETILLQAYIDKGYVFNQEAFDAFLDVVIELNAPNLFELYLDKQASSLSKQEIKTVIDKNNLDLFKILLERDIVLSIELQNHLLKPDHQDLFKYYLEYLVEHENKAN